MISIKFQPSYIYIYSTAKLIFITQKMYHILKRDLEYIFWFIHIPLIIVISLMCVFIWKKRRSIVRECKQITELNISRDELVLHRKNIKINRYTINILIFILTIELLPNIFALVSKITYVETAQNYSLTNSCYLQYTHELDVPIWMRLPFNLTISFHLLLIPSLCFLLKFLYRAYLCHDYNPVIKHWLSYFVVRFITLLIIINVDQIYWFFLLLETILYLSDYCVYVLYANRFYKVLLSRRNEAKYHYEQEYHQRVKVLKRYKVSILVVTIPITMLVIEVVLVNVMDLTTLVLLNNCYFNVISYGVLPIVTLQDYAIKTWICIEQDADIVWLVISIVRKSMVMLLYTALISVNCLQYLVQCKRIRLKELLVPLLGKNTNNI